MYSRQGCATPLSPLLVDSSPQPQKDSDFVPQQLLSLQNWCTPNILMETKPLGSICMLGAGAWGWCEWPQVLVPASAEPGLTQSGQGGQLT